MAARVIVLCGPAGSGKTVRLLQRYRKALQTYRPGATLWLTPTWRAAAEVRSRLLDRNLSACFEPRVMTFAHFATLVLQKAGLLIRPITRQMQRNLLRQLVRLQLTQGRLEHFRPIAGTAGMVDLLAEFISELKRLEIWPEDFYRACSSRGLSEKDRELFELYDAYQQVLREHDLYDAEGAYWSARDVLRKGLQQESIADTFVSSSVPAALYPALVVADGFTDFTCTQHEILALLARKADELYVSLPLESPLRRKDLFSKPQKTLEELRRRHQGVLIEETTLETSPAWPALAHLGRTLFVNPRELATVAAPEPAGIEILAASGPLGEIELIAARIKRLLIDGAARPSEIAVVFRSLEEGGELVREVFGRLGIPVAIQTGRRLHCSRGLRALAALLKLDLDDWPFHRVLAVLGSNYFQPSWPEWQLAEPAAIERTIRSLQVPYGRQRLIDELDAAQKSADFAAALAVIHRLAAELDALPQKATLADWAKAWQKLAASTGLLRAMTIQDEDLGKDGEVEKDAATTDVLAWKRLMSILEESDLLARWLSQTPPMFERQEAYRELLEILSGEQLDSDIDEAGKVRVLTAESIRSLHVPYLFLAGLAEKFFPPSEKEDRLYSEAEYAHLIAAGLPLPARGERLRGEMLLFYEALTRAGRRLVLSYPAFDEKAEPLLPSPFLDEVEAAFGLGRIPRHEVADLSPLPRSDEPLCEADLRVRAVAAALEDHEKLLAGLFRREQAKKVEFGPGAAIAAGLEIIHLRQVRDKFGPAEGILQSAAARQQLARVFPPQQLWAVTDLERCAACPFHFFLERVLRIEPVEEPELESDYMGRGRIVHTALAEFHRRVNQRLGRPGSPLELPLAEYEFLLQEALQQALPPKPSNPFGAALWEVERRTVREWLAQYREQLKEYEKNWKDFDEPFVPTMFEVSFGREGYALPSTAKPLELCDGEVLLSGRIDRVDVGRAAGKVVFNVLDYKSGREFALRHDHVKAGLCLQPPLYALAVQELLFDKEKVFPYQAGYWFISKQGYNPEKALWMHKLEEDPYWGDLQSELEDTIAQLVWNIRHGAFPVDSNVSDCTRRCPYKTICRINQVRALEKTFSVVAKVE